MTPTGIRSYRDLVVWREAMALVRPVYDLTRRFPREEKFCLTAQVRRSVISIPSNIAEGNGRQRRRDYMRFCRNARGSLQELETQLLIAVDLGYLAPGDVAATFARTEQVSRMLAGLTRALSRLSDEGP